MHFFLRITTLTAALFLALWSLPGCSSDEEAGANRDAGAMPSGKMDGGAMEKGKMDSGAMDKGKMDGGAMDKGKMGGGAMEKGKMEESPK